MYVFRHLVIDETWSFDVDEQLSVMLERVRNMTPAGQRSSNRDEVSMNLQHVNSLQAIKKRRDVLFEESNKLATQEQAIYDTMNANTTP
eukprot:6001139-Amphidinium_carterae.1